MLFRTVVHRAEESGEDDGELGGNPSRKRCPSAPQRQKGSRRRNRGFPRPATSRRRLPPTWRFGKHPMCEPGETIVCSLRLRPKAPAGFFWVEGDPHHWTLTSTEIVVPAAEEAPPGNALLHVRPLSPPGNDATSRPVLGTLDPTGTLGPVVPAHTKVPSGPPPPAPTPDAPAPVDEAARLLAKVPGSVGASVGGAT